MTMYDLPENYRELQKLAGEIPEASGKGTKEEIIESIQAAPEEQVKQAIQVSSEDEKEESDSKEKDTSSEQVESSSELEEQAGEDEAEFTYTGSRDQSGDLFDREDAEEQYKATENENGEIELKDDEQETSEQEETDEEVSETSKTEAEPVQIDRENLVYPHIILNKFLRKLLGRYGIEVEPLDPEDRDHLKRNTEVVVDQKLDHEQKKRLQSSSGLFGMAAPHIKTVVKGMVSKEDTAETEEETKEETPEHLQNDKNPETEDNQPRTDAPI